MGDVKLERAARIDDVVEHTRRFMGALGGFLLGAVIGVALVFAFAVTGPLAIALLIASCATLGSSIGEFIGKQFTHDAGDVATGAATVTVGGRTRYASRVGDELKCHSGEVIVSGLLKIFIEGKNATRMTEETRCAGVLKKESGCETVYYGGESVQLIAKRWHGELPAWFFIGREVVGLFTLVMGWRAVFTDWSKWGRILRAWQVSSNAFSTTDKGLSYTAAGARGLGNEGLAQRIYGIQNNPAYKAVSWTFSGVGLVRRVRSSSTILNPPKTTPAAPTAIAPPSRIIVPPQPQIYVPPRPQLYVPPTPRIITPTTPRIITPTTPQIITPPAPKIIIPSSSYIPPYPGPG